VISGAFAAALTPLADTGASLDEAAFVPYVEFLAAGGVDGILACGTTGEGILLSLDERRRVAELFLGAARSHGLPVAVHCGAQTTADTAALAAHAGEAGAAAVAVIPPPYFALDELALERHLEAAAAACAPLPFYVYEFEARAGYAVPIALIERLREGAPNLRGLKVSDKPWEKLEPYLLEGLDVFVGAEGLVARGLARGAAGAVSGLASVYPEVVAALVRERTDERAHEAQRLRAELERFPFHAAAKTVAARRGVPIGPDVRAPLRLLTEAELAELALP
jgi:dihydrodipicolinate synthase/N-acetylneuraminate lyase